MGGSPAFVHPGAAEHYRDGLAYEARYEGRTEDTEFYRRLIGAGGDVLEYGAGTGRLTLPLARGGARLLAVDLSESMLEVLRARLGAEPPEVVRRVEVARGDMRHFTTRRRFDWVVVGFHTFCHLYTLNDVVSFLERASRHLKPGGRLAFDVPIPRTDAIGYDPLSQVCVTEMDGPAGPELLTQRWYQPEELRMHLAYAGFERPRFYGDFSSAPPDEDTDFLAVTARKPAAC